MPSAHAVRPPRRTLNPVGWPIRWNPIFRSAHTSRSSSVSSTTTRPPGPRATCGRELSERPIRSARAGSLGQDMAGRDTGIAPRVLRPIHRSLRSSLSPGADQSGRKPFMIIRVAFAPPTLRRCLARRNPDAKGKDGIFSRAAQPRTRRRALAVYALERRVGLSSPLHTEARARANSCKTPPKNTLKL